MQMKSLAIVSSGFLRNYSDFIQSDLYRNLTSAFKCDVYISTWEEAGYGSNRTTEYSSDLISEDRIRVDFGERLVFLKRESFAGSKDMFEYRPIRKLLAMEPQVLEKYRSKFYSLSLVDVPSGYDVYFHVRFDMFAYEDISRMILECLERFDAASGAVFTSRHIFGRKECFGDIFQIMGHDTLVFMKNFYRRLFDPDYLDLDIPRVPEKALLHYFQKEAPEKQIVQIPCKVKINRSRSV